MTGFGFKPVPEYLMEQAQVLSTHLVPKHSDEYDKNFRRKGSPGDWKNYFTSVHRKFFLFKFGRVLQKWGYERNDDW